MTDTAHTQDPTQYFREAPAAGCPVAHGKGIGLGGSAPTDLTNRPDEGYFGPESVSWRIYADPSSKLGGVAAILLQSLNPMMMRLFTSVSNYAEDGDGRSERTGRYLDTTIFGDKVLAEAAADGVKRLHARSVWTDPKTGQELRADNQEWLAWTHNTLVYGLLRGAAAFGPDLTPEEQERFIVEQHTAAHLVGIEGTALLPATLEELDAYIEENKDWMALTLTAAEITRNLRKPSLSGNPVNTWIAVNVQDGILSLLPDWALLLLGVEGRPMNLKSAAKTTRKIIETARKNSSTDEMIAEITTRVETHPYRKVRR